MFEKIEILLVIIVLLFLFYVVISLGAKRKNTLQSREIKNYLFGVRVLIIIIGIVSFILWIFIQNFPSRLEKFTSRFFMKKKILFSFIILTIFLFHDLFVLADAPKNYFKGKFYKSIENYFLVATEKMRDSRFK